jgi:ubiquinone/menaquinone biosynthesis C-methylase UbiE
MSFDRLAPHYRWMEFFLAGEKLQRCRTTFLDEIPRAGRVLLLGEGNGRFLPACCTRFPEAHIDCVDASAAMIVQARRRLQRQGILHPRVTFIRADVGAGPGRTVRFDRDEFFSRLLSRGATGANRFDGRPARGDDGELAGG